MSNEEEKKFPEENSYETEKINPKDLMNHLSKMKGHELLSILVFILVGIFLFDFFGNNKAHFSEILDMFKTLILTLIGYLFGKNSK